MLLQPSVVFGTSFPYDDAANQTSLRLSLTPEFEPEMNRKTTLQTFALFLTLAGIVACMPYLWSLNTRKEGADARAGLAVGADRPAISGLGWVNGPGPTEEVLKGKVIVVHGFADFCPKCHKGMPALVELHQAYKDKGVVFIGFTSDGADPRTLELDDAGAKKAEKYAAKYKATWPMAFGAIESCINWRLEYLPCYWVIDREGKVVYNKASKTSIQAAIDSALANGNDA